LSEEGFAARLAGAFAGAFIGLAGFTAFLTGLREVFLRTMLALLTALRTGGDTRASIVFNRSCHPTKKTLSFLS
jgi:hypothetical protein